MYITSSLVVYNVDEYSSGKNLTCKPNGTKVIWHEIKLLISPK